MKICSEDDTLVNPQKYDSWLTLLKAAKVRNHTPVLDLAKELVEKEVLDILYHRKCRSLFTMKRDLETLKRKADEGLGDETDGSDCTSKRPSRRSSSEAREYDPVCIFCNKVKFQKSSKSREKLTQAVQLRADQTLRECAIQKGDESILAATSRDIVAAEAHYHVSCYKNYTRGKSKEHEHNDSDGKENETDGDKLYVMIESEAYENLFDCIRSEVIPNKKIVALASLTKNLESSIISRGGNLRAYTKKHIRRTLESELGDSVDIFPDDKGKLLMVPDSVSLEDVVLENQTLHRELRVWTSKVTNSNKIIDQSSRQIRSAIKKDMTSTPWLYHPSDVNNGARISIPNQLERFLLGLLTRDPDTKSQSQRVTTLVQSFSQDVIML